MTAALLALGSSAATSSVLALADGDQAVVFLSSESGDAPPQAHVSVQVQGSSGAWAGIAELSLSKPIVTLDGPANYRFVRRAGSSVAFSVDRGDGTLIAAPVNTVAPAITGTAETGEVLTCSAGTWTTTGTTTYSYQWKRAGVAISGETAAAHTLVLADEGVALTCLVTATAPAGATSQVSNSVTPTAPTP